MAIVYDNRGAQYAHSDNSQMKTLTIVWRYARVMDTEVRAASFGSDLYLTGYSL